MDYSEFMRLFEPLQSKIHFLILSIVRNEDDAADVFQDVALKGCLNFRKLRNPSSFNAWISRIAVNAARDYVRKRRDKIDISTLSLPHYDTYSESDEVLRRAMISLSDSERTVVILRAVQDLPYKDIAAIIHRPESTVRTVYARAIRKLSDKLNSNDQKGGSL